MKDIFITLVIEDQLSEVVARKILEQADMGFNVYQCLCKGGEGYLKSKINDFNQAASHMPFFILTDQDRGCPPQKLEKWLRNPPNKYLFFRIAVMEIESWVMAHRKAFADFFSISADRIPQDLDKVHDPKQFLISLARKSRSSRLRSDIVPSTGSTATIGPDYNFRLSQFIIHKWDMYHAEKNSGSLRRCIARLKEFGNFLANSDY